MRFISYVIIMLLIAPMAGRAQADDSRHRAGTGAVKSPSFPINKHIDRRVRNVPNYFKGFACTHDCAGHKAGYNWAADHDIAHPADCGGNSVSFREGCQAYALEQRRAD